MVQQIPLYDSGVLNFSSLNAFRLEVDPQSLWIKLLQQQSYNARIVSMQ